jgi:hypothetical protein
MDELDKMDKGYLIFTTFNALRSKIGSCALAYHPTTRKNRARRGPRRLRQQGCSSSLNRSQASVRKAAFSLGYAVVAPTTTPSHAKAKAARDGDPGYGAFDDRLASSCQNLKPVNVYPLCEIQQLWNRIN